jgi:hypothetical protein
MRSFRRLFSWTHVIGVLLIGLLAAYAVYTYRVARLPYCDTGVEPANVWWPGTHAALRRPECMQPCIDPD